MSVIKIDVTEDHLKLVKTLNFTIQNGHLTTQDEPNEDGIHEKECAFGYDSLYEEIGLIIYGRPNNFDPMATELFEYSDEQKSYMESLWSKMDHVLELKCFFDHLTPGTYKRKFHDRNWKKI